MNLPIPHVCDRDAFAQGLHAGEVDRLAAAPEIDLRLAGG